jgi:RNA polymerase sigma-70 factor (ECF subfamily)
VVGRLAVAVETGDIDSVLDLLTDDAWLRMPPSHTNTRERRQSGTLPGSRCPAGSAAAARFDPRHGQPAFGCYFRSPHTDIARPYGLLVVTLAGSGIAEITWFADSSVFPHFGLPRTLPSRRT